MEELGVKEDTLETFGAVSRSDRSRDGEGLAEKTGSDLCISVTGIALDRAEEASRSLWEQLM